MIGGPRSVLIGRDWGSGPNVAQEKQRAQEQQGGQTESAPPSAPQPQATATKPVRLIDYSKPRSYFPNPIAPYLPHHVPEASLQNSPRIEQLVHNGTIMLSLDDAIALALENNLDLAIARYNLNIADTDILRAKAARSTRAVATGIVQGTQGGGLCGFGTR